MTKPIIAGLCAIIAAVALYLAHAPGKSPCAPLSAIEMEQGAVCK